MMTYTVTIQLTSKAEADELLAEFPNAVMSDDGHVTDETGELDGYFRRSVGGIRELESHQSNGGNIFLGYPDGHGRPCEPRRFRGNMRKLVIDGRRGGARIPLA